MLQPAVRRLLHPAVVRMGPGLGLGTAPALNELGLLGLGPFAAPAGRARGGWATGLGPFVLHCRVG